MTPAKPRPRPKLSARLALPALLLAALLAVAAAGGCAPQTYVIVRDLPAPPSELGGRVPGEPPASALRPMPAKTPAQAPATPVAGSASDAAAVSSGLAVPPEWIPSGREQPWRHIVIHHSATDRGSAEGFDRVHREVRGFEEMGYHFVITNGRGGADGAVEAGARWRKQKWGAHCGGTPANEYNDYGIGICLVGDFEKRLPSPSQRRALVELVRFLMSRYRIGPPRVIGHRQAPNANTKCPGEALQRWLDGEFREQIQR